MHWKNCILTDRVKALEDQMLDCTLDTEITHWVAAANSAFQQLRRANSCWKALFAAAT